MGLLMLIKYSIVFPLCSDCENHWLDIMLLVIMFFLFLFFLQMPIYILQQWIVTASSAANGLEFFTNDTGKITVRVMLNIRHILTPLFIYDMSASFFWWTAPFGGGHRRFIFTGRLMFLLTLIQYKDSQMYKKVEKKAILFFFHLFLAVAVR